MKPFYALMLLLCATQVLSAQTRHVDLLCHRTANEDVPENTLESLEQAVLLGCDLVEIDIRRTLDGELVLNHDGLLERLTDGVGDVETTYWADLELRDAGSWMGDRFTGLHMTSFLPALRYAHDHKIKLYLDLKTKDVGAEVLQLVEQEGMLQHVQFGGEWADVKQLSPLANAQFANVTWLQPGASPNDIFLKHREGKTVVVNFSANAHGMDLAAMKSAVAAGADAINVDYPRLGADAVGRPVEAALQALERRAETGKSDDRAKAILELSHYRGFRLQPSFERWLLDGDDAVSRAAAIALVTGRPQAQASAFTIALKAKQASARANAAWALGMLHAPAAEVVPLLHDADLHVLRETLLALSEMPGAVGADELLPFLSSPDAVVRGVAALAFAKHQPEQAKTALPKQLTGEMKAADVLYQDYLRRGRPQLTPAEIANITSYYRSQMKIIQALSHLQGYEVTSELEEQAYRPDQDFSQMNAVVAAFKLWDLAGQDAASSVKALGSNDSAVADRAEWTLINAGAAVLQVVRKALSSDAPSVRVRAIRIEAFRGDQEALPVLERMSGTSDAVEAAWAIAKIRTLAPLP